MCTPPHALAATWRPSTSEAGWGLPAMQPSGRAGGCSSMSGGKRAQADRATPCQLMRPAAPASRPCRLISASRGNLMTLWGEDGPGAAKGSPNASSNGTPTAKPVGPASSDGLHNVDLETGDGQAARGGGSKLAFTPMSMSFSDVKYSVPYPKVTTGV